MLSVTIKPCAVRVTNIIKDLINENIRLVREIDLADISGKILVEFKDLLFTSLNNETEELSAEDIEELERPLECYYQEVTEKKLKDKNQLNDKNTEELSSEGNQLYNSLANNSADQVNDVVESLLEDNKDMQKRLIYANKLLEVLFKFVDRFSELIHRTNMSSDKDRFKLLFNHISAFVSFDQEFRQLSGQWSTNDELNDESSDESEAHYRSEDGEIDIWENEEMDECMSSSTNISHIASDYLVEDTSLEDNDIDNSIEDDNHCFEQNLPEVVDTTIAQFMESSPPFDGYDGDNEMSSLADETTQELPIVEMQDSNEVQPNKFICNEVCCGRQFTSRSALLAHKNRSHRSPTNERLLCDICGFLAFSKSIFNGHMNVHSGKHECKQCHYRAEYPARLKEHRCKRLFGDSYKETPAKGSCDKSGDIIGPELASYRNGVYDQIEEDDDQSREELSNQFIAITENNSNPQKEGLTYNSNDIGTYNDEEVSANDEQMSEPSLQHLNGSNDSNRISSTSLTANGDQQSSSGITEMADNTLNSRARKVYRFCQICHSPTYSLTAFYHHMNVHSGKYACNWCPYKAGFQCYLNKHKCPNRKSLDNREDREESTNQLVQQVLTDRSQFNRNEESSTEIRITDETSDDTALRSQQFLEADQNDQDCGCLDGLIYKCPFKNCFTQLKSKKQFIDHRNQIHIKTPHNFNYVFRCDICWLTYTARDGLRRHKNKHSDKYLCGLNGCQHRGQYTSGLEKHRRVKH